MQQIGGITEIDHAPPVVFQRIVELDRVFPADIFKPARYKVNFRLIPGQDFFQLLFQLLLMLLGSRLRHARGFLPEFRRSLPVSLLEHLVEERRGCEAVIIRDPGDRVIRIQQVIRRMEHTDIGQIAGKAHAVILLKEPGQVAVGQIQLL